MLTVKLQRGHTTKIVEAQAVEIFSAGPREKSADEPKDRTNDIREVSVVSHDRNEVFYIGQHAEEPWWGAKHSYLYDRAYIENQNGKTVEVVQPY